jgi:uncharacterized protein (TIGR02996 family)
MSDRQALIEAIREHPGDDTPRLVLADWYDEFAASRSGDAAELVVARAEFIRLQCELARTAGGDPRFRVLRLRELDLLSRYEIHWLGVWAHRLVRWEFHRGFLHSVVFTPDTFLDHGGELFRHEPIWEVAFCDEYGNSVDRSRVEKLVKAPHFGLIRSLNTTGQKNCEIRRTHMSWGRPDAEFCVQIANHPHVTGLLELRLGGGLWDEGVTVRELEVLTSSSHLVGLRFLQITTNEELGDSFLPIPRRAPFAKSLEHLKLQVPTTDDAWDHAMNSGWFPNLQVSSGSAPADEAPHTFSRADGLTWIWNPAGFYQVQTDWLGDAEIRALAGSDVLFGVTSLLLRATSLTEETARLLADAPAFRHVERLHTAAIYEDAVPGFQHLAKAEVWPRLRDVILGREYGGVVWNVFRERLGPRVRASGDY